MIADKSPTVGRIQLYLAIVAPSELAQLFYYTKSLACVEPFKVSGENILNLFDLLLEKQSKRRQDHGRRVTIAFVQALCLIFKKGSVLCCFQHEFEFFSGLWDHVGEEGEAFIEEGAYIVCSIIAALFIDGTAARPSDFRVAYAAVLSEPAELRIPSARRFWGTKPKHGTIRLEGRVPSDWSTTFSSLNPTHHAVYLATHTLSILLKRTRKNVLPAIHAFLAFLWTLSLCPQAMLVLETEVPWNELVEFLNSLECSEGYSKRLGRESFPDPQIRGPGRSYLLPEDFQFRGQVWADLYFPAEVFVGELVEDTYGAYPLRVERCLWLGHRIASMNRWIKFNFSLYRFEVKDPAVQMESSSKRATVFKNASDLVASVSKPAADVGQGSNGDEDNENYEKRLERGAREDEWVGVDANGEEDGHWEVVEHEGAVDI
ncbi:hypothetical protein TESG_07968 [Trichophyton tonsurans CBS 112818]|uniref:DNA/RNA-binding domain-containing protein n=1 Tax=Trichophyton tonsurans (strain CBS 112818) TaxID=647933 RepID=F2SAS1_TRIT1|nr:hypothetical protein TESG_07968 [Trichophyton tonsurans CBS 112818]